MFSNNNKNLLTRERKREGVCDALSVEITSILFLPGDNTKSYLNKAASQAVKFTEYCLLNTQEPKFDYIKQQEHIQRLLKTNVNVTRSNH